MQRSLACLAVVLLVASPLCVLGDLYLQNPRGSNNRLNEQSANRQNADRLFDSQNNNRGGYNVGDRGVNGFDGTGTHPRGVRDPDFTYNMANSVVGAANNIQYQMVYYEGSELSVEWTNQHGCGGNEKNDPHKLNCDIILQYMCQTTDGAQGGDGKLKAPQAGVIPGAESLRDGFTTQTPATLGSISDTQTITNNLDKGHHESEQYYFECDTRSRNQGLFLADQKLNGKTAKYTRQNNNGNRRGLECPEERDYYPYWSPSPWKDVVIMTDHPEQFCDASGRYKGASQNTAKVGKCEPTAAANEAAALAAIKAITETDCIKAGIPTNPTDPATAKWTLYSHNIPAPLCRQVDWSRVNHLGNGRNGQPLTFNWTLPTVADLLNQKVYDGYTDASGARYFKCVARLRYNMSTDDYDPYNTNATVNGNQLSPVTNNPTVDVGAGFEGLKLAVNTAQFGRTFQDRSHVFYIRERPASIPIGAKVYNLNVRGKRGNIVETFPATEYDFQPSRLVITPSDFVHVQWTGSNTHNNGAPAGDGQAGDSGEGRTGTDRTNIAQLLNFSQNYPMPLDKFPDNMWSRSSCYKLDGSALTSSATGPATQMSVAATDCAVYLTTVGQFKSVAEVAAAATATQNTENTFDPLLDNSPASLVGGVVMKFSGVTFTGTETSRSFDYMCTRNNNFSNRGQKGTIVVKKP